MPDDFSSIVNYVAGQTAKTGMNNGVATVDFGSGSGFQGDTSVVTVNQAWVTPTSRITLQMALTVNSDHDSEDAILEQLDPCVINKTNGSFDIECYAPTGTFGKFDVVWSGR